MPLKSSVTGPQLSTLGELQALGLRYAVVDTIEHVGLIEDLAAYAYQSNQPAVALLGRSILGA